MFSGVKYSAYCGRVKWPLTYVNYCYYCYYYSSRSDKILKRIHITEYKIRVACENNENLRKKYNFNC